MKIKIALLTTILLVGGLIPYVGAEGVPSWVKNNAGWWADGTITESEFIQGIQFLIKDGIIVIPPTTVSADKSQSIPDWVKNNAGWWADGTISDQDFVNGIQHLIKTGIISITAESPVESTSMISDDSKLASLNAELEKCVDIKKAYERLNCERSAKHEIESYTIMKDVQPYTAGPLDYYWAGFDTEGNSFEITDSGQAILSIRLLAVNTGSSENVAMMCTGPAVCNYDVWNGENAFKYSGMDFTNGQIIVKPGESAIFNMLFGPNIGYGGTTFEYDSSKEYYFRVSEPYGSVSIPLGLK